MKWSLVCELAEGDQSHMGGSDIGQAQHSLRDSFWNHGDNQLCKYC